MQYVLLTYIMRITTRDKFVTLQLIMLYSVCINGILTYIHLLQNTMGEIISISIFCAPKRQREREREQGRSGVHRIYRSC